MSPHSLCTNNNCISLKGKPLWTIHQKRKKRYFLGRDTHHVTSVQTFVACWVVDTRQTKNEITIRFPILISENMSSL